MSSRDELINFVFQTTGDQSLATTAGLLSKMSDQGKLTDEETIALTASLKGLAAQSKAVNDALSQKAGLAETTSQLTAAKQAYADLGAVTDTATLASSKYQKQLGAAQAAVDSLTTKQNLQQVALTKNLSGLEKAGVDTSNLAAASAALGNQAATVATSLGKVGTAAATASTATSKVGTAAETVKSGFEHATETVGEFIKRAGEITGITGLVAGLVTAISGFKFFEAGAEEATHFDDALGKLRATTTLTGEQFETLKKSIEGISSGLDVTATEGAQAAAKLAAAFGDANKAVLALPATLELAKAAQIDVGQAADIVATSLKAFGLQAQDAGLVADTLATVALKTGQSLSGLSSTFSQLAPFAKAVGLSFTDTAAILGVLAQKGIDSESALGGLRGLFEGLRNPTSALRQELVGLGIDTSSFSTIIAGLSAAGPKAEDALDSLGTKGKAAILALVQDGGAGLTAFESTLGNVAGAAKRAGDQVENTLLGSFKDFGNALSNLAGGALSTALDPIKVQVQSLTELIKGIPESAGFQAIQKAIGDFATSAVASFKGLLDSIDFTKAGQSITDFVSGAGTAVASLGEKIKSFGSVASAVVNGVAALFEGVTAAIFATAGAVEKVTEQAAKAIAVLGGNLGELRDPTSQLAITIRAFGDSADESFAKAKAAADAAASSFQKITAPANDASAAVTSVGDKSAEASTKIATVGKAAESTKADLDGTTDAGAKTATALDSVAASATLTGRALAQANFDKAKADLEALSGSATLTAAQLDAAQAAVFRTGQALDKLSPSSVAATNAIENMKAAFVGLGVQSQASLDLAASKALNFFKTIDAGSAQTAAGLADRQNAFIAYAAAALAAAKNISQSQFDATKIQLDSQAAALGLSDAVTKAGVAGAKAGKDTADGFQTAKEKIAEASAAAADLAGNVSKAAIAADAIGHAAADDAAAFAKGLGGVLVQTEASTSALNELNEILQRTGSLQGIDLVTAQNLLTNLGAFAGTQAKVLQDRIAELQQAAQKEADAAKALADQTNSLQDQIDELTGNAADAEDRRHTKALADAKAEAEANGTYNTAAYKKLVDLENQLHALKLKNIATEKAASDASAASSSKGSVGSGSAANDAGAGSGSAASGFQLGAPPVTVNVHVQGSVIGGTPEQLSAQLARLVLPELKSIAQASR